jgi:hypothetical protein
MVTVLDGATLRYTDYDEVAHRRPVTTDGLTLSFLAPGTVFDLEDRSVVRSGQLLAADGPP